MTALKPFTPAERDALLRALKRNSETGAPIHMDAKDTTFVPDEEVDEQETINAIQSVPTHY